MNRSIFFRSFTSTAAARSKPCGSSSRAVTSPPTLASISGTTASGIRRRPDWPAASRVHIGSMPTPRGDTIPMPVTTILPSGRIGMVPFHSEPMATAPF